MIKGIIFDCFGVIYRGSIGYLRSITPANEMSELDNLTHAYDLGYISQTDYIQGLMMITQKTESEILDIFINQHIRDQSVINLIKRLKKEYKIALLSNAGQHTIDKLFTDSELSELFCTVVISSDVHMVKPHSEIFEFTSMRMGLLSTECILIDDISANIDGAQRVGMKGIVYKSISQAESELAKILEQTE